MYAPIGTYTCGHDTRPHTHLLSRVPRSSCWCRCLPFSHPAPLASPGRVSRAIRPLRPLLASLQPPLSLKASSCDFLCLFLLHNNKNLVVFRSASSRRSSSTQFFLRSALPSSHLLSPLCSPREEADDGSFHLVWPVSHHTPLSLSSLSPSLSSLSLSLTSLLLCCRLPVYFSSALLSLPLLSAGGLFCLWLRLPRLCCPSPPLPLPPSLFAGPGRAGGGSSEERRRQQCPSRAARPTSRRWKSPLQVRRGRNKQRRKDRAGAGGGGGERG